MPAPRHDQGFSLTEATFKQDEVEFDASERLRLMQTGLPLCIFLESSEIVALKPPAPLYIFVPRVAYLPTLIDKCHEHFKPYIQPSFGQPTSPFFDFCGIPIDWRLPVGVAFDILSSLKGGNARKLLTDYAFEGSVDDCDFGELSSCGCDVQLPWCLTIHFHGSVSSYVRGGANKLFEFQEFLGWASFESFFINSLKQATYIINGSATPFQRLAKAAEMQLLTALRTGTIAQFLDGCSQLLPTLSPKHLRRIPVRLYICGPPCIQLSLSFPCFKTSGTCWPAKILDDSSSSNPIGTESAGDGGEVGQHNKASPGPPDVNLVTRCSAGREAHPLSTLGDLVHYVLPQLFPRLAKREELPVRNECTKHMLEGSHYVSAASEFVESSDTLKCRVTQEPGCIVGRRSSCVVVHGIQPLLQTPLFWLATTVPQLDMFLHIVILVDEAVMGTA